MAIRRQIIEGGGYPARHEVWLRELHAKRDRGKRPLRARETCSDGNNYFRIRGNRLPMKACSTLIQA